MIRTIKHTHLTSFPNVSQVKRFFAFDSTKYTNNPIVRELQTSVQSIKPSIEQIGLERIGFTHKMEVIRRFGNEKLIKELQDQIDSVEKIFSEAERVYAVALKNLSYMLGSTEEQPGIFACYSRSQNLEAIRNSECGLVIQSKNDYNGALDFPASNIAEINRLGLTSVFQEASDTQEIHQIISTLTANKNRISLVQLRSHGGPLTISLGTKQQPQYVFPSNRFLCQSFAMIDRKAIVLLQSCSTGKERVLPSFGRILSYFHPEHTVIAPTRAINCLEELSVNIEREASSQLVVKPQSEKKSNCAVFRGGRRSS